MRVILICYFVLTFAVCPASSECIDKLALCSYYSQACKDNVQWAMDNCAFYCNLCDRLKNNATAGAATTVATVPLNELPSCGRPADVVFVLDSSGSVGSANFNKLLQFVKSLVQDFDVGLDKVRIGVETFSTRAHLGFHLKQYGTKQSINAAIDGIKYIAGSTHTDDAINYLSSSMFVPSNGGRSGVPKIAIIFTDGISLKRSLTAAAAASARLAEIQLFCIGIGSGVSMTELNTIATDPDTEHVMNVNNFNDLGKVHNLFARMKC